MIFTENRNLHDNLRAHFQTLDVQHLNAVLLESGVTDLELRKNILQNYFFTSGEFFDSGWFEAEGKKYSAIVCFREVGGAPGGSSATMRNSSPSTTVAGDVR